MASKKEKEILESLLCAKIDKETIQALISMNEQNLILAQHHYWKGANGCWYTKVDDASKLKGKKLVKRKSKEKIEKYIISYYSNLKSSLTIKDIFDKWVESKIYKNEIKDSTLTRYKNDFRRYFKDIENVEICTITPEYLESMIDDVLHEKILNTAFRNYKIILTGIFKYAKKMKLTDISIKGFMQDLDISPKSLNKTVKDDDEEVFTDFEAQLILNFIRENPTLINLGIALVFFTGLRAGELSSLKWQDINFKKKIIHVQRTEVKSSDELGHAIYYVDERTKTEASNREIDLSDDAIIILKTIQKINPFGEYIFMTDECGRNHSNSKKEVKLTHRTKGKAFTAKLKKICKYVGINPRSLHKVRKTYATKLINEGIPDKIVQGQLGHEDISTTLGYYYRDNFTKAEKKAYLANAVKY